MKRKLLFLGGTCGKNNWREDFTKNLIERGVEPSVIFNPVVADWNQAAQDAEEAAKAEASHMLFYLGNPYLEGSTLSAYSMVEATMALYEKHDETVVIFDPKDIEGHSLKAFNQCAKVLKKRFPTANIFTTLEEGEKWLADELK